jgi:hypothetical protein
MYNVYPGYIARLYMYICPWQHNYTYILYISGYISGLKACPQEAKCVKRWPNTTSAWAGWSRFDIPVDRYGIVHSLLHAPTEHWGPLPASRLASRKILIEQNIKKETGPSLCVLCGLPKAA